MQKIYDVAIIGGGVVGCSIFSELSLCGKSVILIEKELDVATGMSKANSGLIHAGFDAMPGTKKALFNVQGSKMYPSLCKRLGLPIKSCGAYVVGNDIGVVKELYNRGIKNGVEELYVLNEKELRARLPMLAEEITCGLYSNTASIIDPYLLTICLAEEGVINGGKVELGFEAQKIDQDSQKYKIYGKNKVIFANKIINCAGAGFNEVSKLIGAEEYETKYRRGEYYVLDHSEANIVPSTIFPLPSKDGKGVLVTPTIDGNILVGPTSYVSDESTKTTDFGLSDIRSKVSKMLTNVNLGKTIRVFSGVRVIVGDDFVIEKSKIKNGVINVAGICSPGLSSAPAISKYVVKELLGYNIKHINTNKIVPYFRLKDLSFNVQNKYIKSNPDYGKIVCKCEAISLGEIKDAINRPIRPTTMDGVKRRVRAGMGRCQGGFCSDKVAKILASENKVKMEDIVKEHKGGYYLCGDIGEDL